MSELARAIKEKRWDVAALCLLLGMVAAISLGDNLPKAEDAHGQSEIRYGEEET